MIVDVCFLVVSSKATRQSPAKHWSCYQNGPCRSLVLVLYPVREYSYVFVVLSAPEVEVDDSDGLEDR